MKLFVKLSNEGVLFDVYFLQGNFSVFNEIEYQLINENDQENKENEENK